MSRDPGDPIPPRRSSPPAQRPAPPPTEPAKPTTSRPNLMKPSPQPGRPAGDPNTFSASSKTKKPATTSAPRVLDVPEEVAGGPNLRERLLFGGVGSGQLAVFCRQFAAYLDAGVDLRKALASLERQFARTALGPVIGRWQVSVRRGDALAEAVAREPQAFDGLFLAMIKVAEARGGMPETLRMLARHYEARQNLIRQARSAMIYPIAVLVIATAVVAALTIWLLPMFARFLQDVAGPTKARLPLPSRALMAFSRFVQSLGWWLIPLGMVGLPFLLFRSYKTTPGKRLLDRVVMHIPVLGKLVQKIDTTRFARTLATLLGSGVDVSTSIDLTADVMQLDPLRSALLNAKASVMEGNFLSESLAASQRFGPDVIAVIESGEETGKLPESLEHLADDYEEQVASMVKNLGQLIQPLLMIMLGGVVLFIILAVILPYVAIINSLTR